jgi:hypothetical protein
MGDRVVILYSGNETKRFLSFLKHLLTRPRAEEYRVFRGEKNNELEIIIKVKKQTLDELHSYGSRLSDMLETKLSKAWKILPDKRLPEYLNIYTLPYKIY